MKMPLAYVTAAWSADPVEATEQAVRSFCPPLGLAAPAAAEQPPVGEGHPRQQGQQVDREQRHVDVGRDEAEQRRHEAGAHIGAGHLHADDGLGFVRPEVVWGGVDDAGVDGGAAQADEDQPRQADSLAQGEEQGENAGGDDGLAQADELAVVELEGEEAVQRPAGCDADEEQPGKPGGRLDGNPLLQYQVAAGPQV